MQGSHSSEFKANSTTIKGFATNLFLPHIYNAVFHE